MNRDEIDLVSKISLSIALKEAFKEIIEGDTKDICQTFVDIQQIMHERHNLTEGLIVIMMSLYNGTSHLLEDDVDKSKGILSSDVYDAFIIIAREFLNMDTDKLNELFILSKDMTPNDRPDEQPTIQ